MSGFVAVFHRDGSPADGDVVRTMAATMSARGPDGAGAYVDGPAALAHRLRRVVPAVQEGAQPALDPIAGLALVSDARLDDREALAGALGIKDASGMTDGGLILAAYRRWGADCARHLVGDFAFALWDSRARVLFCARDVMGVRPLYLHETDRRVVVASEVKALLAHPDVPRRVVDREIQRFLALEPVDREATVFEGVRRLPAAHTVTYTPERSTRAEYWRAADARDVRYASDAEYEDAFRATLSEAVRCRLRGAGPVGATLSGGLDSSAIVCLARGMMPEGSARLRTYSLVFPDLPDEDLRVIDERAFIAGVRAGGGIDAREVRGDRLSPLGALREILACNDEPFSAPNLYLHWGMYAAARADGTRVLLDGFDGDSAVSHGLARLHALVCDGAWETYEAEVRAFAAHRGTSPAAVLEHFGLPHLEALATAGRVGEWARTAGELSRRFALRRSTLVWQRGLRPLTPASMIAAWRAIRGHREVDEGVLRVGAAPPQAARPMRERETHVEGLAQPLYQLTLELADKCARSMGVEPRYPFFDRRLIELCVGLPDEQKFSGGWPRSLFRRAMTGILPPEVQWRGTKGNLSPNFHRRLRSADAAVLRRATTGSGPALARWVDPAAAERLCGSYLAGDGWRGEDARGHLLFRTTVLATWLASRGEDAARAPEAAGVDRTRGIGPRSFVRPGRITGRTTRPHDRAVVSTPHREDVR